MTKRERSLKAKLLTLTLSINLALGAVSFILEHRSSMKIKDQLLHGFHQYGEILHDGIAAQFFERYGDIQAFSKSDTLLKGNKEEMAGYLNDMVALYGIYDLVLVVNKNGKLVAVNDKAADGTALPTEKLFSTDFSNESWFKKTLAGETSDEKSRGFSGTLVEDFIFDTHATEVYGNTRYTSTFAAQMKNKKGEVIGVICNRANVKWISFDFQLMAKNFSEMGYKDFKLGLLDSKGALQFEIGYQKEGESTQLKLDPNRLKKLNFTTLGFAPAKKLFEEKQEEAFGIDADPENKSRELYYSAHHIDGDKWVPSVGWSVMINAEKADAENVLLKVSNEAQKIYITLFLIVSSIALVFSIWFSNSLARKLEGVLDGLTNSSKTILGAAQSGSRLSTELAEGATEQAAAIQETAAAVDEVAAMVKKNADNAAQSRKTSAEGSALAENGKQSMSRLVSAIGDIRQSNEDIMKQVEDGNQKISEIVHLITEIESKTKVINDIVFQTKLLSFNASVEAARAGEHGKGFAVVAEEVGNLAQMSGNAAKEISEMLTQSVTQVETIVNSTRTQVSTLIERGKSKVLVGTELAEESEKALDQLLEAVTRIDSSVSEIAEASREQSQGTSEIQKAINQLDQVTQQNSTSARESASTADDLNQQVTTMHEIVEELRIVLKGGTAGTQKMSSEVTTTEKSQPRKPLKIVKKDASSQVEKPTLEVPSENDPRFQDVG